MCVTLSPYSPGRTGGENTTFVEISRKGMKVDVFAGITWVHCVRFRFHLAARCPRTPEWSRSRDIIEPTYERFPEGLSGKLFRGSLGSNN